MQAAMEHDNLDPSVAERPARRLWRRLFRPLIDLGLAALTEIQVQGRENLPSGGPLLVVANHFTFMDPVVVIRTVPWNIEFLGGAHNPGAPAALRWLPRLWGRYAVFRGTGARAGLLAAEAMLRRGGVLGVFPEAGNWAAVLRPARPGAAFLAARTQSPILPIGLDGLTEVLPQLQRGRRARVTVRIGKPFGPFRGLAERGRERRRQLDEIGHQIMRCIAELIPPERRGHYSDDPAVRAAARSVEVYPWADEPEW